MKKTLPLLLCLWASLVLPCKAFAKGVAEGESELRLEPAVLMR